MTPLLRIFLDTLEKQYKNKDRLLKIYEVEELHEKIFTEIYPEAVRRKLRTYLFVRILEFTKLLQVGQDSFLIRESEIEEEGVPVWLLERYYKDRLVRALVNRLHEYTIGDI